MALDTAELVREFVALEPQDRYLHLIDLGKRLVPMPTGTMVHANRMPGCQASVWLCVDKGTFYGDSDAVIVRGLVYLVLEKANGGSWSQGHGVRQMLKDMDMESWVTASRQRGIGAMIDHINYLYKVEYRDSLR